MTCGIYMIQNKVNNKIYIGQAVDIDDRWGKHKAELSGNYHDNTHLQRSWNKYGEDNFEFTILLECEESDLNMYEEYYIFELMAYDPRVGYNKTYGGQSGRPTEATKEKIAKTLKGHIVSEQTRKKLSEANKGENHPNYGKHLSEKTRKKISEAQKIAMNRPEVRKNLSESSKGRTFSEETRRKISESIRDKCCGENNPNYGKLGIKHHSSIPIVQLTLDGKLVNVYGSSQEAGRNGFHSGNVCKCCRGKLKTHRGYKWMYLHEYISKLHPNIKTINLFGKTYEVNQEEVNIG